MKYSNLTNREFDLGAIINQRSKRMLINYSQPYFAGIFLLCKAIPKAFGMRIAIYFAFDTPQKEKNKSKGELYLIIIPKRK